ncbi:MAG TPA: GNAT family N-acetyltransferase [Burkholderiales bacterium]|nr:GNAT family N-acetyltransferase [Burkholderiales bacterium]
MADLIETERLRLRPFRLDDAVAAYTWLGDPIVMRYTPTRPDSSVQKTRDRLAGYETHQLRHGFSKWLVVERASGQPVGDAGLLVLEGEGWIELGFRFERTFWGRGFATEVGAAWVSAAFGDLGLDELGAFVHPENTASLRVLEKLGFRGERRDKVQGMPAIRFTLQRSYWNT